MLKAPASNYVVRVTIDATRHVILSIETLTNDKVQTTTKFDNFVQVAGGWWARSAETVNDKNERQSLSTLTVTELAADEFAKRLAPHLTPTIMGDAVVELHSNPARWDALAYQITGLGLKPLN